MRRLLMVLALGGLLSGCDGLDTAPRPTAATTPAPGGGAQTSRTSMYVFNGLGRTIDEVDLETLQVHPGIMATGLYPNHFSSVGEVAYLVNSGDADVYALDLRARQKRETLRLPTGSNPMSLTMVAAGKGVVVNYLARDLAWADLVTRQVEATVSVPVGAPGGGAAVSAGKLYVPAVEATYGGPPSFTATYTFSGVHVYDLATRAFLRTVPLANDALASYFAPGDVSTDPAGRVVVTVQSGLAVIDPATDAVVRTVDFGAPAHSVQYVGPTRAYAAAGGGMVSFDPQTGAIRRGLAERIESGGGPFKVFGGVAYVTNFASDSIRMIDLATEAPRGADLLVGDGPQDLVFMTVVD